MKFAVNGDILQVSEIIELATATANSFQSELSAALSGGVKRIVLDLSQTTFVDCGGLGALVAMQKKASNGHGTTTISLLNPPKPLQQIVNMMKMGDIFPMEMSETPAARGFPIDTKNLDAQNLSAAVPAPAMFLARGTEDRRAT